MSPGEIEALEMELRRHNGVEVDRLEFTLPNGVTMEQVGWCWPHSSWPDHTMYLSFDGIEPPPRVGLRAVYAPVVKCICPGRTVGGCPFHDPQVAQTMASLSCGSDSPGDGPIGPISGGDQ